MSWRDERPLLDMLLETRRILRWTEDKDLDAFMADEILRYAVMHALGIIGEAARVVSETTRGQHPEIPWTDIVGMRNRLIHEYFRVDYETVWDTVELELPGLLPFLEAAASHLETENEAD